MMPISVGESLLCYLNCVIESTHTVWKSIVMSRIISFFLSETAKTKVTEDDSELDISALCPKVTFFSQPYLLFKIYIDNI